MTDLDPMTRTATFIRKMHDFRGDARLYRLDPPLEETETCYSCDHPRTVHHNYVVVSGINNDYAHETYIFRADEQGEVVSFSELDGSFRGGIDHDLALSNAGYEVRV